MPGKRVASEDYVKNAIRNLTIKLAGARMSSGGVAGPHDLLSSVHSDVVASEPVRGDIICANSTPAWTRLPLGANGYHLRSDGNDVAWVTPAAVLAGLSGQAGAAFDWNSQNLTNVGTIGCAGPFTITQNADTIVLSHDGSVGYLKWTGAALFLKTDEGTNTATLIYALGKGTGAGYFVAYDEGDDDFMTFTCSGGVGYLYTGGAAPSYLSLQGNGHAGVRCFVSATSGLTPALQIYGFRAADALRSMSIAVGAYAADTASFDGVSNYLFDGLVNAVGGFQAGAVSNMQNIYPITDDTYYLGKNDDDSPFAWKGLILKDTTDGKYYRIECINGVVTATDLTD